MGLGGVAKAFQAMDKERSGHLTKTTFPEACARLKWGGNAECLHQGLDFDGRGCAPAPLHLQSLK